MGMRSWLMVGVAAAVAASVGAREAGADLGGRVVYAQPAGTLVMPFDSTGNKQSFAIVSRVGGPQGPVATHWSYWADDCKHLADVLICLTADDTVVVDPTALRGEIQIATANQKIGPLVNLSGTRGMVTVTAFVADPGPSGAQCQVRGSGVALDDVLVGSWTIANIATNSAFGSDAIGLSSTGALPDPQVLAVGIFVPTFNPQALTASEVIVLPVEFPGGSGAFEGTELGPLTRTVTCDTTFIDNLEIPTSLPDLKFSCAAFKPISAELAAKGEVPIIPPTVNVVSSGLIHLSNCRTSRGALNPGQFVFAFHGQTVGPFGTLTRAKYTGRRVQ